MHKQELYEWTTDIRMQGYYLMAQLLARPQLFEFQQHLGGVSPFDDLLLRSEPEVTKALVSFAALARAKDDATGYLSELKKTHYQGVGTLTSSVQEEPLSAREACNKIIHAQKSALHYDKFSGFPVISPRYYRKGSNGQSLYEEKEYLFPFLTVHGETQGGRNWVACINLVPWIFSASYGY